METQEWEELRAAQSEATTEQPDFGREQASPDVGSKQVLPDLGSEQVLAPRLSPKQLERQPEEQPEPPLNGSAHNTPTVGGEHGQDNITCQQWLRWLAEQVSGVADQLDEEQRRREHRMRTTTEELVAV